MSNKLYDILSKIQRWLPALGILYMALCSVWQLPYGKEVNETILAVSAFMAATLEISTGKYNSDMLHSVLSEIAFSDDDEAEQADDPEAEDPKSEDGIEA